MSVLDAAARVLFAHAHPDDETIATGALIAELAGRGVDCAVLTATRGERGEIVSGVDTGPDLEAHRQQELARALALLGVETHYWLGTPPARQAGVRKRIYRDSGMRWIRDGVAGPGDEDDDESFTAAPAEAVTGDLAAAVAAYRPDLVITYDDAGGYGHPDHVRLHHVCLAAAGRTGVPVAEIVTDPARAGQWFDLPEQLQTVTAALRRHASQLTVDGRDIIHVGGQREPIRTSLGLRLLTPRWS